MPKQSNAKPAEPKRRKGRPATGSTRRKISITVPTTLLETATKAAFKKGESVSQFISRAIQNLTLES